MTKKSLPVCCTHQCRMNFLTGVLFQNHTNIPFYTHPTNKVFAQFIGKQYPTNSRKTFFYNKKLLYTIDVKQCIVKYNDTVITFYQCKHELFLVCHIYHATSTEYSGNISMHSHSGYILIICYDKCNVSVHCYSVFFKFNGYFSNAYCSPETRRYHRSLLATSNHKRVVISSAP